MTSRAVTFDLTLCTHPKVDSAVTYWKILQCLTTSQGKRLVVMQKVWTVSLPCQLSSKCFHLRCVWGHTRIAHWFCSAWNFAWEIIRRCCATMSLTVQTFHKKSSLKIFSWQLDSHTQLSARIQGCCAFARTSRTSQGSYRLCRLYHITQDMKQWLN